MRILLGFVAFLFILGAPVAGIYSAWYAVNWVLGPLDRAAKNRLYPIQFTLADFLCLFVEMQLLLAVPATIFRSIQEKSAFIGISLVIVAAVLLVWWTGVHTLSRAGVHNTLGRASTLTLGIPFGYAGSLAIPVVAVMFFISLVGPDEDLGTPGGLPWPGYLLLAELATVLMVAGLGHMTRRILAGTDRSRNESRSVHTPSDDSSLA